MSKLTNGIAEENTHIKEDVTAPVTEDVVAAKEEVVEKPIAKPQPIEQPKAEVPNGVISLDMSEAARTKIWVNGDCQKVIELNLTDMGIITRFSEAYPKLLDLQNEIGSVIEEGKPEEMSGIDEISNFALQFKSIDKKMRDYVDYIFDGKVSDVCCDGGSMYDPVAGGWWRFEYIIDKLGNLYHAEFGKEMKANEQRMKMHTDRYTGKAKYTKPRKSRK